MLLNLKKTLLFIGSSAIMFAGCGDDGNNNNTADAAAVVFDAAVPDFDAPPPNFAGTLSLAEVTVTNPTGIPGGLSGAVATISFTDVADVTVPPQTGYDNNVGACRIFVYDVANGEAEAKGSDGGPVTVSGTKAGEFTCAFNDAAGVYACASTDEQAAGVLPAESTATPNGNGTVTLSLASEVFTEYDPKGGSIILTGFEDAAANGRFSVLARVNATTLILSNPALQATATLAADGTYATLVGTGPIPGGYDFLDNGIVDGTKDMPSNVTFAKAAATNAPAVDTSLQANGDGFLLSPENAQPHAFPVDGSPVTFSCESSAGGNCGAVNPGFLKGMILFGSTTDAELPENPAAFSVMPAPVNSFATFQCSDIAGINKVTLDAGAIALILGTNPTRIQTSITYANAALAGDNTLLVSHGVVGFTDVPTDKTE